MPNTYSSQHWYGVLKKNDIELERLIGSYQYNFMIDWSMQTIFHMKDVFMKVSVSSHGTRHDILTRVSIVIGL